MQVKKRIKIGNDMATICNGVWEAESGVLSNMLNSEEQFYRCATVKEPHNDGRSALRMAHQLGGVVMSLNMGMATSA